MAAGGVVSTTLSEWLLVALILVSLVIEFILHRFEHWIMHHHSHLVSVVRVLYRELMVLGLVSFIFIIYETVGKPDATIILSFEFAHVFIFLFAIFYTFVVLSSMLTSLRLSTRWKEMERMDVVNYLSAKNQYTALRSDVVRFKTAVWRLFWWFPNVKKLVRYIRLHEIITFHDIRFQFIYYRNLPEDFRFSSFLRKIKSITFIHLVESHWSHYVIFLAITLADIARRYISNTATIMPSGKASADGKDEKVDYGAFSNLESAFVITAAIVLAICAQILSTKIRRVYWELTKHPRLYYEGVQPETFREEYDKLERDRASLSQSDTESGRPSTEPTDLGNEADDEGTNAPGVSMEDELLNPMHLAPLRNTPAASIAPISTNNLRDISERSAPTSARTSLSIERQRALPKASPTASQRTSLERPRPVGLPFNPPEQRAKTDLSSGTFATHHGNHDDFDDIVARHSLEVQRAPPGASSATALSGTSSVPSSKVVGASIALAAVEAAKKRKAAGALSPDDSSSLSARREASVEVDRALRSGGLSPGFISTFSSRRGSLDEIGRNSIESRGRRGVTGRSSIEMAVVMPRDELAARFEDDGLSIDESDDGDAGNNRGSISQRGGDVLPSNSSAQNLSRLGHEGSGRNSKEVRLNMGNEVAEGDAAVSTGVGMPADSIEEGRLNRSRSVNPTILRNLEQQRRAQTMTPSNYPRWVVKVIPRLGRVASPVEKLFWFGSHQFYLWCVEFVLFFSTVLLAASCAGTSLLPVNKKPVTGLNISSVVLSFLNLLFILFKTAGIMKRYIFILHNASLIPEVVAIEAIQNVRSKRVVAQHDGSESSGSDMDREDMEVARERRLRLGRFFRTEAEEGKVPGIEGGTRGSRSSWDQSARRRWRRRRALRRRSERTSREHDQNSNSNNLLMNSAVRIAVPESDSDIGKQKQIDNYSHREDSIITESTFLESDMTPAKSTEIATNLPVADN